MEEKKKSESLQTFDFYLKIPAEKVVVIGEEIKKAIEEAEIISGVESGKVVKKQKPPTRLGLEAGVTYLLVSVGTLFLTKFVEKYADQLAKEFATDTATVIREAKIHFSEWLKKRIRVEEYE
uniref:Uncharacterized protein n=1 Tax=Candidatus Methanophagaceae archaeon ANME-1 ERB6 TaxID=2759912 RepID=A0A7G9YZE4_9EURY|nr:hypothetical protein OJFPBHNK_00004 [Methanosarcinales archaeon ANME-1 ERB6]